MTSSSQTAPEESHATRLVLSDTGAIRAGAERVYALNKLKASPDNVRKHRHSAQTIEQRAASILAKGLIQLPVIKPERRADGTETGYALVTAGEGRRLALRLLAKRKLIPRTVAVRCLVDEANDAGEVSLDENISREPLHPADEFEAFKDLAERLGWGAEAIGARFGVSPAVVRQRLRLSAVAPDLIAAYRQGELTLDQLMAFTVSQDQARQLQVFAAHGAAHPTAIRRVMTEASVAADERRVIFVGLDAYLAAGGVVVRDLFADDRGGYLSDVALIDRLVADKLAEMASHLASEGWKWTSAHLDYPHGHGLSRVWPKPVALSADRLARREALASEYEAANQTWNGVDELPAEIEARLTAIEEDLAQEVIEVYAPEDLARAGAWVVLGYDGRPRIERGLVRAEDTISPDEPDGDEGDGGDGQGERQGEDEDGDEDPQVGAAGRGEVGELAEDPRAPLSAKLVAELTAHRTAGLRLALANDPDLALVALTHVLALTTFYRGGFASCLEIKAGSAFLPEHGEGIKTNPAQEAMETRFELWAKQMPEDPEDAWAFVVGLDADSRASLLAFCVGRTLNAVRGFGGHRRALLQADALASATGLDMTAFWTPTAERYLARVTKAQVLAAVARGVSPDMAQRLSGLKKADLVAAAQDDLVKAKWLPPLLRTKGLPSLKGLSGEDAATGAADQAASQDDHAAFEMQHEDALAAAE